MFNDKSLRFLEELMDCSGPSGFEEETAAFFRKYLSLFSEKVYTDVTGNTIGVLNGKAGMKVMLAGHYDEIGFQVVHISDEGLIYFRTVGGIDNITLPGTEVEILTAKGRIPGIIGKKPIHIVKPAEREKVMEPADLWMDIGAENKKEAQKIVTVGDPVAVKSNYARLGKYKIKSKGMDDKIGAFVVAETLRELSARKLNVAVFGVGTVQEELGLRGAITSAYGINPQVGFAIDVGFATDTPSVDKKQLAEVFLGKGPILARNADNNPVLGRKLRATAKKHKVKFQESPGFRASGGTDTAQIQLTRGGVATALISIPNRYMHTPVETCDIRDVEGAVKLLVEYIASMSGKEEFVPGQD